MPAAIPALVAGVAGVAGAAISAKAGSKAAKAQQTAANQQVAESRRQYDQDREDWAPWRSTGGAALARLANEYGGGTSSFEASPGYDFRRTEGLRSIDRERSARGLLNSGAADKARMQYGDNLASAEYGDWWNRNLGLAGMGQNATAQTSQAGQAYTGQINNAYQNAGNARASSYANTGSAINSGINNVLSAYLYQQGGGFGGQAGITPPGGWVPGR